MTSVIQVLQAAHIIPYKGVLTNHLTNGIILRSDIHDLFDLNLIGIDTNYKIVVSSLLKETEYESFNGLKIQLPSNIKLYPSIEALKTRPLPFRN